MAAIDASLELNELHQLVAGARVKQIEQNQSGIRGYLNFFAVSD